MTGQPGVTGWLEALLSLVIQDFVSFICQLSVYRLFPLLVVYNVDNKLAALEISPIPVVLGKH